MHLLCLTKIEIIPISNTAMYAYVGNGDFRDLHGLK